MRELATFPLLEDVWEDLGRALSIDDKTLQLIGQKCSTPIKKQKELFRMYLKNRLRPTWDDIIKALLKIGKLHIAEDVVETLELPQELLTAAKESLKPVELSTKSTTDIVELDAPLVPARISKTELHNKHDPSVSDKSGIFPFENSSKRQVVVDVGSPTSPQRFDYCDSSAIKGKLVTAITTVPHAGAGGREEVDHSNPLMINNGKSKTAQLPIKIKSEMGDDCNEEVNHTDPSIIKSIIDHVLPDRAKPHQLTADSSPTPSQMFQLSDPNSSLALDKSRSRSLSPVRPKNTVTTDNGGSPSKSKQSHNCDSLTVNKERPKTAQEEPINSTRAKDFDGAPRSNSEDKSPDDRLDENDSLSSDEFHSAGELPLDEKDESDVSPQHNTQYNIIGKVHGVKPRVHVSEINKY